MHSLDAGQIVLGELLSLRSRVLHGLIARLILQGFHAVGFKSNTEHAGRANADGIVDQCAQPTYVRALDLDLILHGVAAQHNDFGVSFTPEADLPGIARAASGAWARTVSRADELPAAVKDAFAAVRAGQPAVLSAHLPDA